MARPCTVMDAKSQVTIIDIIAIPNTIFIYRAMPILTKNNVTKKIEPNLYPFTGDTVQKSTKSKSMDPPE